MKKLNVLFLLFVGFLGMTAISSCTPSENEDVKPNMSFSTDGAAIAASKTVAINAPLLFKVTSTENPNTKKNLKTLRVQSFKNNSANIDTTVEINSTNNLTSFNFNATDTYSTEEKFTFTLTDKAGETATKTITITTESAPVATGDPINTYTATLLGAQNNATEGSYLDASTGTVYKVADANTPATSALIDMIYYYGSSNLATVVAPTDATVNGGAGNLTMATGMTTKNATVLNISSTTASEFDAMVDDLNFPTSVTGTSIANSLAVGSVVEFQTVDGKIGLFKVTNLNTGATGDITIEIKIAQ